MLKAKVKISRLNDLWGIHIVHMLFIPELSSCCLLSTKYIQDSHPDRSKRS